MTARPGRGRQLGFAVVGCGAIAPAHAEAVQANGCRVAGFLDERHERAEAMAARFGARAYRALEAVLDDPSVDAVTIATPSGLHADVAVPAARAGKHVLVEKPIDVTLERGQAIVDAARDADVRLSVVSQHRFDDSTIAVHEAIQQGRLGRIGFAQAQVLWHRTQAYYDADEWRGTWRLDGGGALMNQSIHSIDLLRHLAGEVETVRAMTGLVGHERIEVEDLGIAAVRFRSGALGAIVGTTAAYPGFGTRIEIYGERGAARIEDDRLVVLGEGGPEAAAPLGVHGSATPSADPATGLGEGHRRQVADFIDAIRESHPPLVDGAEGLRTLALVLAIYEAAREGREVTLGELR